MKLRNKLTIILLIAFIFNISILTIYYKLNLSKKVSIELNSIQRDLDDKLEYISSVINSEQDYETIKDTIKDMDSKYEIYIEDANKNVIYGNEIIEDDKLNISSVDMININNETYMIKLSNSIAINTTKDNSIFIKDVLVFEIIIISIILVLLTIIIYREIVRPILLLQKDIENYKYKIKPTRSNRKDEIGWLKDNFVNLTEKLEDEKENQNRIIASISHDIKTPLTSIMGYAERIKNKEMSDERKKEYIEIIYLKSQDIKGLIDEFDDYISYNIESSIKKEKITVQSLVKTIQEEYEDELAQLGINLFIECNCEKYNLNIDILKIRRVFGNIIGNAVKHINKEDKNIKITYSNNNEDILISISDNGNGIDECDKEKIFEALYTSDKSRKVAGLGLSICKSVVKAHGGEIWAQNNCEGGLTINFTLKKYKLD